MAEGYSVVFGMVKQVETDGYLSVSLDDGRMGMVAPGEIGRNGEFTMERAARMVGQRRGFHVLDNREDGILTLSARSFEDAEYERICEDYRQRRKNVYSGTLFSVTENGRLAFYRLAQGITGGLHVSRFTQCFVRSFRDVQLPHQLTVVVSGIDEQGRLKLSAKPAFGTFEEVIDRLRLEEGAEAEGMVSEIMAGGMMTVMLAPNLAVLVDITERAFLGEWVRIKCRRIDWERHRVKAQLLGKVADRRGRFDYEAWQTSADQLPEFVDAEAFEDQVRIVHEPSREESVQQESKAAPDFSLNVQRSPFATYDNERVLREAAGIGSESSVAFEIQAGYLGERHLSVAKAVDQLIFSSAWQLRRFLYLQEGMMLSDRELKRTLDRMIRLNILGVLRIGSDMGHMTSRILVPASNYEYFCQCPPRGRMSAAEIEGLDAACVKEHLAVNQLFLGALNALKSQGKEVLEAAITGMARCRLQLKERTLYLAACRKEREMDLLAWMKGLEDAFCSGEQSCEVLIAAETLAHKRRLQRMIAGLNLSIPNRIVEDLDILSEGQRE